MDMNKHYYKVNVFNIVLIIVINKLESPIVFNALEKEGS